MKEVSVKVEPQQFSDESSQKQQLANDGDDDDDSQHYPIQKLDEEAEEAEETIAALPALTSSYHKPEDDFCDQNPEFAVICSFLTNFGDKIELDLDIEQLKSSIENRTNKLDESLIDLHVKLLKKIRRYFVRDQWEKALIRFTSEYSYEDAYELEQLGYLKTRPSIKLELLRRLLDAQFECDQKFKASVNLCDANVLRILPLGRDIKGNSYWQQTDKEGNFRIYQEQPLDYKSWKTICAKPEELNYLIEDLQKSKDEKIKAEPITEPYNPLPEIFPELFNIEKEDSQLVKQNDVDNQEGSATKKRGGKSTKKGRGRGRCKKSTNSLSVLQETEEEQITGNNATIKNEFDKTNGITNSKSGASNDLLTSSDCNSISHESQVNSTLENLISKVVSSFDKYLIRPLSRNSTKSPTPPPTLVVEDEPVDETKPKKKQPAKKREKKKKEEELPRRASSRIQQLTLKKIAEQEEEMKKMIESSTNKDNFTPVDEDSRSRSTSSRNRKRSESPEEGLKNGKGKRKKGQSWRRGKGKKKLSWDKDDSDLSGTSSLTESNDDEFEDDQDETFNFETANEDDDEFACEEEDTNNEPVIVKRARTARQSIGNDQGNLNDNSLIEEDKPCGRCDKSNEPEWILLCDMCDDGYHTSCCLPPLMIVPDGDWFCPPCEHKMLLTKLQELYASIIALLEEKERERIKRQKLRQNYIKKEAIKIEQKEILLKKRQRGFVNELNEPLALQEFENELDESTSGEESSDSEGRRPKKRVKKQANKKPRKQVKYDNRVDFEHEFKRPRKTYSKRNISDSEEDEDSTSEESSSSSKSSEEEEVKPKTRRARASVSYRFQEYDELIKSAIRSDSIEEETGKGIGNEVDENEDEDKDVSDDEEEEEESDQGQSYGRGKDMATIEALAYQQENGIDGPLLTRPEANKQEESKTKQKIKKKSRRLNDLDAASETEGASSDESFQASSATDAEDDEDEDLTEADSYDESSTSIDEIVNIKRSKSKKNKRKKGKRQDRYESDDEDDYQPTRSSRRAAAMKVSYKESTDEEEEETMPAVKKSKKVTLSSDEESQASWNSLNQAIIEDDDQSTSCDDDQPAAIDESTKEEAHSPKEITDSPKESMIVTNSPTEPTTSKISSPTELVQQNEQKKEIKAPKVKNKRVKLAKRDPKPITSATDLLNESIDELILPVYRANSNKISKASQEYNIVQKPVQIPSRDPIQELNQYCSESVNSATMFNSYNETLLNKPNPSSPPHVPFYDEDDTKPTTTNEKQKKSKKSTSKVTGTHDAPDQAMRKEQAAKIPMPIMDKSTLIAQGGVAAQRSSIHDLNSSTVPSPRQQIQPLIPNAAAVRFDHSNPIQSSISPRAAYPIHPNQVTYSRSPYTPTKYNTQQTPLSQTPTQMHHYPHNPYENHMNSYIHQQQLSRPAMPIHMYPNSHLQGGAMWVPSTVSGTPPRPPMPPAYYSPAGPLQNPNFSIHQLLGNPYSMPGLAPPTSMPNLVQSQPQLTMNSSLTASQQSLSQSTNSSDDPNAPVDKDMIRGMSDVISFIGDT